MYYVLLSLMYLHCGDRTSQWLEHVFWVGMDQRKEEGKEDTLQYISASLLLPLPAQGYAGWECTLLHHITLIPITVNYKYLLLIPS